MQPLLKLTESELRPACRSDCRLQTLQCLGAAAASYWTKDINTKARSNLKVHICIHGLENTLVFHAPFEFDQYHLADEAREKGLGI